jgi:hypothetical protein
LGNLSGNGVRVERHCTGEGVETTEDCGVVVGSDCICGDDVSDEDRARHKADGTIDHEEDIGGSSAVAQNDGREKAGRLEEAANLDDPV